MHDNVKALFLDRFNDGMTPGEAIRMHENELSIEDRSIEKLASGAWNPLKRAVYNLYSEWKALNFEPAGQSPLEKIKQKVDMYVGKGQLNINISVRECINFLCFKCLNLSTI